MKQLKSFWAAFALMAAITVGFSSCDDKELPPPDEGGNTDNPEIVTPEDPDTYDYAAKAALVNAAAADLSKLLSGREIEAAAWNDSKQAYVISFYSVQGDLYLTKSASTATVENAKLSVESANIDGNTVWYWKSNGALLKDAENNNVSVDKLPSFKIENKKWQVSTTSEMDANDNTLTYSNYADLCDFTDADKAIDSFFASIIPETTIGEGENAKKVASFKLIDGTEFNIAYHVAVPEPPQEKTLEDIVTFEIKNIGSYTVDVECIPTSLCDKYTATIWCTAEDSAYDEGESGTKDINYEKMTRETLGMFKESLTPNGGMQQHLISTAAHTYSEQDLIKGTPYNSDACKGFPNLFPGKNPYAIYVMALDKDGNYYIDYKEISVKSTTGNQCTIPVTISATPSQTSIEATITAEGASRVITYFIDGAYGSPTISDEAQQAKTMVYNGQYTYNTANEGALKPDHNYYIVVIAINAEGKVCLASQSVKTKKYEPDGSGTVTTASFEPQTLRKKLNGTIEVSSGATAIRTLFLDSGTFTALFEENSSNQQARINEMFLDPQKVREFTEEQNITGTTVDLEFDITEVAGEWVGQYAIWANVKDANGNWSRPQNLAGLAKGTSDSAFTTYWDVITEDAAPQQPITFNSTGSLLFTASTAQTEITTLPVSFTATGLDKVRFYIASVESLVNNCTDDDYNVISWTEIISNENYESYWTEVSASAGSINIPVAANGKYVILASGIEANGHTFTTPVNVAALIQGHASNATGIYQKLLYGTTYKSITVPEYITIPSSLGGEDPGEDQGIWGGTTTLTLSGTYSNGLTITYGSFDADAFDALVYVYTPKYTTAPTAAEVETDVKSVFESSVSNTQNIGTSIISSVTGYMFAVQNRGYSKMNAAGGTLSISSSMCNKYGNVGFVVVGKDGKCKLVGYYDLQAAMAGNAGSIVTY